MCGWGGRGEGGPRVHNASRTRLKGRGPRGTALRVQGLGARKLEDGEDGRREGRGSSGNETLWMGGMGVERKGILGE
uniref:Uncharacterized protein n=1 Tax=Solanum lycopersicum TaxID=4081 RepID=A0A3Q7I062_SOLLC